MKKTYIAPQIEIIVFNRVMMMGGSPLEVNSAIEVSEKSEVLSKGFAGGLWEEDSYEE